MKLVFIEKNSDIDGYLGCGLHCENNELGIKIFIEITAYNELINKGVRDKYKIITDTNSRERFIPYFSGYVMIIKHDILNEFTLTLTNKINKYSPKDIFDLIKKLPLMSDFTEYEFEIKT